MISKKVIPLFFIFLLISSCSSIDDRIRKIFGKSKKKEAPTKVIKALNYGPSKKISHSGFIDKTKKYGLDNVSGVRFYGVDFNNDKSTDLIILPDYFSVPEFYQFNKKKQKYQKIKYKPFGRPIRLSYLNFTDINKDGVIDALVVTLNQKSELTKSPLRIFSGKIRKGKIYFTEQQNIIQHSDLEKVKSLPISSVSLFDYDLDGKLDMYLGNWFQYNGDRSTNLVPDWLLKGNRFKFYNYTSVLQGELYKTEPEDRVYPNATPSFATSTCDIDQNGYPDVLVSSSSGYRNKMWMNIYDKKRKVRSYQDYAQSAGLAFDREGQLELTGGGNTFTMSCADYNNDGIFDVFVGELFHYQDQDSVDRSSILTGKEKNFPPKFIRTQYTNEDAPNWSQGDRRSLWFDYNNDGLLDLLVDNSGFPPDSRLVLFEQQNDHSFINKAMKVGVDIVNPAGSIILDINNDGRMDILTGQSRIRDDNIKSRVYLFENHIPRESKRSIRFYLSGRYSNSDGIGSLITLRTNRGTKKQWVEYNQGAQGSQNEKGISFGLRSGEKAQWVQVAWPYRGRKGQLKKTYNLRKLKFKRHLPLTLCENGRTHIGQKVCRR